MAKKDLGWGFRADEAVKIAEIIDRQVDKSRHPYSRTVVPVAPSATEGKEVEVYIRDLPDGGERVTVRRKRSNVIDTDVKERQQIATACMRTLKDLEIKLLAKQTGKSEDEIRNMTDHERNYLKYKLKKEGKWPINRSVFKEIKKGCLQKDTPDDARTFVENYFKSKRWLT